VTTAMNPKRLKRDYLLRDEVFLLALDAKCATGVRSWLCEW
jgi:hypothetical protein